jgi:hypothetical protein
MSNRKWFEIEIYNAITQQWEYVARIKSKGLAYRTFEMLEKVYGDGKVRYKN